MCVCVCVCVCVCEQKQKHFSPAPNVCNHCVLAQFAHEQNFKLYKRIRNLYTVNVIRTRVHVKR